jgi:hypothetical protein
VFRSKEGGINSETRVEGFPRCGVDRCGDFRLHFVSAAGSWLFGKAHDGCGRSGLGDLSDVVPAWGVGIRAFVDDVLHIGEVWLFD